MKAFLALLGVVALPLGAQTRTCTWVKQTTGAWRSTCTLPSDTVRKVDTVRITITRVDTVLIVDTIFVRLPPDTVVPPDTQPPVITNPGYPHEPLGATVLWDWDTDFTPLSDCNTPQVPTGCPAPFTYIKNSHNLSTVSDPTAPVNTSKVGRVRFSTGCCAGSGPAQFDRHGPPSTWQQWYVSDWVKFDPLFTPDAGIQKIFSYYLNAGQGGGNWVIVKADNNNGGTFPLIPRFTIEYVNVPMTHLPSQEREVILPGVWYQYEVIVHRSGRLQMWIRPQGGTSITVFDGTPNGMGTPDNPYLTWWWGYGGMAQYSGPTAYINHNHIRVSWK